MSLSPDGDVWTISRIIQWTQQYFTEKRIDTPRLDAEVLLAATLGVDRIYLYTHYDQPLTATERDTFRAYVRRRGQREPVAYILGQREFFGRMFAVNRDVLIPRPETEHLIEMILAWLQEQALPSSTVLDLCTGSGAIGVTLALEDPGIGHVAMTDLSPEALAMARKNATALGVDAARMSFLQGDLFAALKGAPVTGFDVIVSNPPYVEAQAHLAPDVRAYEPGLALFGGHDGLDVIRRIAASAHPWLKPSGVLVVEMGSTHAEAARALFEQHGWRVNEIIHDLQGLPRAVVVQAAISA